MRAIAAGARFGDQRLMLRQRAGEREGRIASANAMRCASGLRPVGQQPGTTRGRKLMIIGLGGARSPIRNSVDRPRGNGCGNNVRLR